METKIADFCNTFLENEEINNLEEAKWSVNVGETRKRTYFYVKGVTIYPMSPTSVKEVDYLVLDKEDLEYLFNKYSERAKEEMDENIKELQSRYEHINRHKTHPDHI